MQEWALNDVEVEARANPTSFLVPSENERKNQSVGNLVQLHFLLTNPGHDEPHAERMWVEISKVEDGGNKYEGTLMNQPKHIQDLNAGDTIRFEARHIGQTIVKRDDPRWLECGEQTALVSKLIFESGNVIRFAYRQKPDNQRDSGRRLMAGTEGEEYNNDPDNIALRNIGWLVDFDPSLYELFKNGVDTVFERRDQNDTWTTVTDWQAPED